MRRIFLCALAALAAGCSMGEGAAERFGSSAAQPIYVGLPPGVGNTIHVDGIPTSITLEGDDIAETSYATTTTVGTGEALRVVPRVGEPVVLEGAPMVAQYYHLGRILAVEIGPDDHQRIVNFVEPVSWETFAPQPAAGAPPP